ncbi:MAG: helix-turn-helix transcriptional regulator [Proteobacteria bacterium]|nr:helix-turn-helix transcriptional regulator [Pseudomonadota bacterium]
MPAQKTAQTVTAHPPEAGALGIHLRYSLEPGQQDGASLDNPLFALIAALVDGGSIRHAADLLGTSYRYVWDSVRKWESVLGEPLVTWSQGKRARPTQFAHRLLWAERRARTRMQPHIEALRSDLEHVIADARDERQLLLTMSASHDLAVSLLQRHMAEHTDLHLAVTFSGSVDSLRSLNEGQCLIAGFHVPVVTPRTSVFARALKPLLEPNDHTLIACARRTQGLMVRKEDAQRIRTFEDVSALRLRFVNRQAGSGTRMLVDHLRREHSIRAQGFTDHVEQTHVAVGLCVASGVADAGVGIEAAALQFGLHFVPLLEERYFLACLTKNRELPAVRRLREILAGRPWAQILTSLAGYQPDGVPGEMLPIDATLPWWRNPPARRK